MKAKFLESSCVVDAEGRKANLQSALARGLPTCSKQSPRDGALAIVGSGPSVGDYLDEIRNWDGEIWGINGAYDYLLDQGIIADGFIGMDPLAELGDYVLRARPETTFYVASTCDASLFDNLKGHSVRLWHAQSDDSVPYPAGEPVVGGGTTCITRAPFLANLLGWRDITLFGADSSFTTEVYCYARRFVSDLDPAIMYVECNGEGPFATEISLLKQVAQLGVVYNNFRGMLKIKCGGLLDAYLKAPTEDDSNIEIVTDDEADQLAETGTN